MSEAINKVATEVSDGSLFAKAYRLSSVEEVTYVVSRDHVEKNGTKTEGSEKFANDTSEKEEVFEEDHQRKRRPQQERWVERTC